MWFVLEADPGTVYLLGSKLVHQHASKPIEMHLVGADPWSIEHHTSKQDASAMHASANVGWEQVQATLDKSKKRKREVDRYLLRVNHPHDRVLAIEASSSRRNPFQSTGTQGVSGDGHGT